MYTVYSKTNCSFCVQAKRLLSSKGIDYNEVMLTKPEDIEEFKNKGFRTVPQIFDDDNNLIGTFSELKVHLSNHKDQWPDNPLEG